MQYDLRDLHKTGDFTIVKVFVREDDGTPLDQFDMFKDQAGRWVAWTCDTLFAKVKEQRRLIAAQCNQTKQVIYPASINRPGRRRLPHVAY